MRRVILVFKFPFLIIWYFWREVVHGATFLYRTIERANNFLRRSGFGEVLNPPYRPKMLKIWEIPKLLEIPFFRVRAPGN